MAFPRRMFCRRKVGLRVVIVVTLIQVAVICTFLLFGRDKDRNAEVSQTERHLTNQMGDLDNNFIKMFWKKKQSRIVFVEEHQDVIPYWLQAAENGQIWKSGNTLRARFQVRPGLAKIKDYLVVIILQNFVAIHPLKIHIDAHSDGAPPPYSSKFPWKLPKSLTTEVYKLLMTSNDAFIVSSIAMGLIDKFIWIKPLWTDGKYTNITFEFGITDSKEKEWGLQFCVCEWEKNWLNEISGRDKDGGERGMPHSEDEADNKHLKNGGDKIPKKNLRKKREGKPEVCLIMNRDKTTVMNVSYTDCKIKVRWRYYEVGERKAVKLLTAIRKMEQHEPKVILDIDEDYFGVENRVTSYKEQGGQEKNMEGLDTILAMLFCPKAGGEKEMMANKIMLEYVQKIITKCHSDPVKCDKDAVSEIGQDIFERVHEKHMKGLFCDDIEIESSEFSELSSLLWSFSKTELLAVQKIKFCVYSFIDQENSAFQTCKGVGDNGYTKYHMPNRTDIWNRAKRFEDIVSFVFKDYSYPGVTTVCRSMRDGYTPARHFQTIERSIKGALRNASSRQVNVDFHHDSKLLFGPTGWTIDNNQY